LPLPKLAVYIPQETYLNTYKHNSRMQFGNTIMAKISVLLLLVLVLLA